MLLVLALELELVQELLVARLQLHHRRRRRKMVGLGVVGMTTLVRLGQGKVDVGGAARLGERRSLLQPCLQLMPQEPLCVSQTSLPPC